MLGVLILIGITSTGFVLALALIAAIILYGLILRLYVHPARDLKRLEGISKHYFPSSGDGGGVASCAKVAL
jgi:hypothetical protein